MIFGEKSNWIENACFEYIYNFCLKLFVILRRERDIIPCEVRFILWKFNETQIFWTDLKKTQISIFKLDRWEGSQKHNSYNI